ncbi:MAG TPA: ABC transporter permease [Clostridiaceae bacterium]|nr:ABC transporter permease [Clostridiaceae bacterium]
MRIRWLLTLIRLKLSMIARRPLLIAFCLIMPVLMSLLAGSTLTRNDLSAVRGAYVDLANNEMSTELVELLKSSGLEWIELKEDESSRAIATGTVDGVVIIPAHYGEQNTMDTEREESYTASYLSGNNTIASDLVIESYLISALALTRESVLIEDLLSMTDGTSVSYDEMRSRLKQSADEARVEGASLKLEIHNLPADQSAPIVQIPDFAVEILFLSIFSLLGSLMMADPSTQQRLRSIHGGPLRDYVSSLIALAISGIIQSLLMAGFTQLMIPRVNRPDSYWLVMAVFLLLMLAFGQLVSLIPSEQRFVPASLLLFVSALIGGTFIKLPSAFVEHIGQYTPHGWAFACLSGMSTTLPLVAVAALGFVLLILSYVLQIRCQRLVK